MSSATTDIIAAINRLAIMLDLDVDTSDGTVDAAELIEVLQEACKALAVKDLLQGLLDDAIKLPRSNPSGHSHGLPNRTGQTTPYTAHQQPVYYPQTWVNTTTSGGYQGTYTLLSEENQQSWRDLGIETKSSGTYTSQTST